ncbi:6b991122-57d7-4796-9e22-7007ac362272 [Thermothielavioides terrestris]|uniref:6b991122-57d7-4796-9e22-7007ac362272 n=1 Tax=Thermothielavioides terrestris TaxID=2587410 RepID=A0A446BGA5_9PEZI|nr:6b991122-57d7-4796-9e22-7007ac362272 [Thermothielavioides terrestris]
MPRRAPLVPVAPAVHFHTPSTHPSDPPQDSGNTAPDNGGYPRQPSPDRHDQPSEPDSEDDTDGEDDDSVEEYHETDGGVRGKAQPSLSRPLGCPYRKRNPARFNIRDHPKCTKPFADISRLKRHIFACHMKAEAHKSYVYPKPASPQQSYNEDALFLDY